MISLTIDSYGGFPADDVSRVEGKDDQIEYKASEKTCEERNKKILTLAPEDRHEVPKQKLMFL